MARIFDGFVGYVPIHIYLKVNFMSSKARLRDEALAHLRICLCVLDLTGAR